MSKKAEEKKIEFEFVKNGTLANGQDFKQGEKVPDNISQAEFKVLVEMEAIQEVK